MSSAHHLARITAHLLHTLPYLAIMQLLLLIIGCWLGSWASVVHLLLSLFALYLHIRLAFDQRIFQDFANALYTPNEFDHYRLQLGLGKVAPARDMPSRCQAALRLWRILLASVLMQYGLIMGQLIG